jgi:O-antigen/teichoic acid export membrane protein
MAGRPGWNTCLMVLVVAVNVTANALLIPRFGIAGAAAGTALAFGAFALLLKRFAQSEVGVRL